MPQDARTRDYTWADVKNLIWNDMGLTTDEERRTKGEMWYVGQFAGNHPEHEHDHCIRVAKYDKTFDERLKDQVPQ